MTAILKNFFQNLNPIPLKNIYVGFFSSIIIRKIYLKTVGMNTYNYLKTLKLREKVLCNLIYFKECSVKQNKSIINLSRNIKNENYVVC